jgi:hypothetical protein
MSHIIIINGLIIIVILIKWWQVVVNFNANIKKPLLLVLSITVIFASTPVNEDETNRPRKVAVIQWQLDPAYISDNPCLYIFSRQLFQSFFNWQSANASFSAWQLPNLSLYFPWMNQTQTHKRP